MLCQSELGAYFCVTELAKRQNQKILRLVKRKTQSFITNWHVLAENFMGKSFQIRKVWWRTRFCCERSDCFSEFWVHCKKALANLWQKEFGQTTKEQRFSYHIQKIPFVCIEKIWKFDCGIPQIFKHRIMSNSIC